MERESERNWQYSNAKYEMSQFYAYIFSGECTYDYVEQINVLKHKMRSFIKILWKETMEN